MAMAVDQSQRSMGALGFDQIPYSNQPQFTNPWASTNNTPSTQLFPNSLGTNHVGVDALAKQQAARANSVSMPYSSIPVTAPSIGSGNGFPNLPYGQSDSHTLSQDLLNPPRSYGGDYSYSATTASPTTHTYAPTSAPYSSMEYAPNRQQLSLQQQQQEDNSRRLSQPSVASRNFLGSPIDDQRQRRTSLIDFANSRGMHPASSQAPRESFGDALDAGRGMVAMSQNATPRNIYAPRSTRGSHDSYGFPSTHSSNSSISSASTYPYYGSVDSSVTDYSSTSESLEPSRTLPRPSGLVGNSISGPPAPQSMMSQFSSKVASSSQKKHKCKICDKRFTRPSSLQTHMYSHTGEKRELPSPLSSQRALC
ncbi:MAG: hypothetical protein M1819_002526 [Sarea resinae]|nr:MAG: hypothetical protein M1819_002526 [Sarea resinae]